MAQEFFPDSQLPIRRTVELLPQIFQTEANKKFLSAVVDPLVQPGVLQKTVGYVGRRYGKTYNSTDIYLDTDNTLRSRYQLEPGVVVKKDSNVTNFYDYLDFKNQIKFFGNKEEFDAITTNQEHYTWNPPIDWDKFVNYREYYWVPEGPPAIKVLGQAQAVVSTYKIGLGVGSVYLFTPDGMSNNPTLTLYRGQTYKFQVNVPANGFLIKTALDTGTLLFNPNIAYTKGQLVIFDEKLWKAKVNVLPADGSSIDLDSQDWEFVDDMLETSALDYNKGVTNNGIENGTITFEVPFDAPDVLFYQSSTDPNKFGRFIIGNIETNSKIDIEKEILGKVTYTSSNGIELTNGMLIYFLGQVTPSLYSNNNDKWLVEGVGTKITLTKFTDLIVSENLNANSPEILFDNSGFDSQPFDDASSYPASKDYITVNKSSLDSNPWSRYNRWFHRETLDFSHTFNGTSFEALESSRAKRPIIEFKPNLQLFNHGSIAKQTVDYVDDFTTDVFSTIEGSKGYIVDGEQLFDGARVLITADTDSLANNRIYIVRFIKHNNVTQITLQKAVDAESIVGDCVLVRRGNKNKGLMYHFSGSNWIKSQLKTKVNQSPLFDIFDEALISFSDADKYPVSSFAGTELLSYVIGDSVVDSELGFSLSYLNINNVGDIQFEFDLDKDQFTYKVNQSVYTEKICTGYYRINGITTYDNGWKVLDRTFDQPIIDSTSITEVTNKIVSTAIAWDSVADSEINKIIFYVNGVISKKTWTRSVDTFTFSSNFAINDIVTIKIFADLDPVTGYYEIPLGLEKNPLNDKITSFTLGQASDHILTGIEVVDNFSGIYPGTSNLRNIAGYENKTRRFLKHSNVAPLSMVLLCDKEINIIKSIQYSKKSYTDFKNTFIDLAYHLYYDQQPLDYVDIILEEISKTQNPSRPFAGSDMIGSGAYTTLNYTVEDEGIKTFALSQKFDLETLSSRAVYVYRNNEQLLTGRDYTFNSTFGFVLLNITLTEGDTIQIREYVSTSTNFIPPTPTKLGLYKKYEPKKFLDNTYVVPKEVIQGHDGSITVAYGDFRDDVLLELEKRIYNNIKQHYNETIFDNDKILGGYFGNSEYGKTQLDSIASPEFLKWIADTNIDYVNNTYFDSEDSFTYTYSNMTDPIGTKNLPGYWRGVYNWVYDTDRPHRCPWEMLGFSEMPTWWESEYGPAPYTSNNLILWEDLRDGIIRQGDRAGIVDRYKRPSLMSHIPVDGDGNLLSPLNSGLAGNFTLINNKGSFVLGDQGPVESAWRLSSEWPFAVTLALCLLKPFEYITDTFNKSETTLNLLGQTINKTTRSFATLDDIIFENSDVTPVSGLVTYVVNYLKSKTIPLSNLVDKISNIDVALTSRLSGFVDQAQQKYVLDSKNPKSTTSSIFIPQENYDIIFNVSSPIYSIAYSGVIIEKTSQGWKITGYDSKDPYFTYYKPLSSQTDPIISVGGVSENFLTWTAGKFYGNGIVVKNGQSYYRSIRSHTSSDTFDTAEWKKLPELPVTGAVQALRRKNFNRLTTQRLNYGTLMTSVQEVVDFMLGYQEYLISIGFIFDGYDPALQDSMDWFTSVKEFMFWSKHNWSEGSLLTLSPNSQKINVTIALGVADSFLDSFYDYQILQDDGTPLRPEYIEVSRDYRNLTLSTINTNRGIYFMRANFVLKEHVVVFDDRTVFNDVMYDKPTGYRQERIKSRGFRTVDWDGDYTSPGFLFDNVNIQVWQPFTDYRLGDIVAYKSFNWTSKTNQLGSELFNDSNWTKLDSTPTKGLVANFDYRINQFEDYYEVEADGVGSSQRDLARHAIGYQPREYLQGLAEDEISQFRIYQGFIREKGSNNSITKIFDKLSRTTDDSVVLNEEWAFKVGELGGVEQLKEIEFEISKSSIQINPQPTLIVESQSTVVVDQNLRIDPTKFTISPTTFTTNINPVVSFDGDTRSAGYVHLDDIEFIVKTRDDILNIDINSVNENDHFWITFDKSSWTVLRYNETLSLRIVSVLKDGDNVTLTLNRIHDLSVDDIVGITYVSNLTGFYKITAVDTTTITVTSTGNDPAIEDSTSAVIGIFTTARFNTYQNLDYKTTALLATGSKIWVDFNEAEKWEVVEKIKQYQVYDLVEYGMTAPLNAGTAIAYIESLKQVATSLPTSGYVMIYSDRTNANQALGLKQIVPPPDSLYLNVSGTFGETLVVSPDYKWLAVGSPKATAIPSPYIGEYDPSESYLPNEIVLHNGKLWKAKTQVNSVPIDERDDGSTVWITFNSHLWEPATLVEANTTSAGTGFVNQGMVSLYTYRNDQWENVYNILSPRQATDERFGSAISFGISGTKYYMAISATGSLCDPQVGASTGRGRVYMYYYDGTTWSHHENPNYLGVYDASGQTTYPAGSIVWAEDSLWQSLAENQGDGSSLTIESNDWLKLDPVSTSNSLPTNVAIDDDGSTLAMGLLTSDQQAELIKDGDNFGHSLCMSRDGAILAVGVPNSDGQFFNSYKGVWNPYQEYVANDVVKHENGYYILLDIDTSDSATVSKNERPDEGSPWEVTGDSTFTTTGKVFIYNRNANGVFNLVQTITNQSLDDINDIGSLGSIASGDNFGTAIDIDASGTTLIISSPTADILRQNQGAVYVFKRATGTTEFRLKQKLQSYENYTNEYFGTSVSISAATERVVIGAKNAGYSIFTGFEYGTTFDRRRTAFSDAGGFPGQVYVYERKDQGYFLSEKLEADFENYESFGACVDCTNSIIAVGSPTYIKDGEPTGKIRLFKKTANKNGINTIRAQEDQVDLDSIKNVEVYDNEKKIKIADVDYVDHYKLKILSVAEEDIKFKTVYDPATYVKATDNETIDESQAWFENHIGEVWWDLSTVKFVHAEQDDISYRSGNWGTQVQGSSVDVYEWVETALLPSEWSILADTVEGLAEGISGQPKHADDTVYNTKVLYNATTGNPTSTMYYFWVKNKTVLPANKNRRTPVATIASYINSPISTGIPFIAFLGSDKLAFYNFSSIISTNSALINIEYNKDAVEVNPIHREYQLLTEGVADNVPAEFLERKWIDSLVGFDEAGNSVPDNNLSIKQRYGLSFRPRQTMFVDRAKALRIVIDNINTVLSTRPFVDTINFENLSAKDNAPSNLLNQYDLEVNNFIDLQQVGTVKVRQAVFSVNIIDGEIDTIDIVDSGFGYRTTPYVVIEGTGKGAKATITLDTQGRVSSITVTNKGKKYLSAIVKIREFSVLVNNDSRDKGFWAIYSWDQQRKIFYRSKAQGYDTTAYWEYTDWWATGFSSKSRITAEITSLYEEPSILIDVGSLLRVKEYSNGGWAVLEKTTTGLGNLLDSYNLVGRENGTIYIKDSLYNASTTPLGYDNVGTYDDALYDLQPNRELRNILKAAKENIFVDDLRVEWNKLFFGSVKYAFSEQVYVDWAFKTSFLNAIHNVGDLDQRPNYKNDNLDQFRNYIEEVKPYRTTIREYTSRYTEIENFYGGTVDFDLPPAYSVRDGKILPVSQQYNRFNEYPWKWWADNNGYSITSIVVANAGGDYKTPPTVLITGNGSGASATAFVANGKVSGIRVDNPGSGYTSIPTVSLVGGNGTSQNIAKAAAVMGDTKVRTFDLTMKFDRITKTGLFQEFTKSETFVATGYSAIFNLKYCPTRDKTKIRVVKNGETILNNEYNIAIYKDAVDGYTLLKGRLEFYTAPKKADSITIEYEKNDDYLDAVNRINKYYAPTAGMKGKEINQLMTGIDFGGVQVQGTTFEVTGGWDALPWYTDNWDSVESNSDYHYIADGSTTYVVLPYVPENNAVITIYLKRVNETRATRIDDPYFLEYDGVTVQPNGRVDAPETALMPTFIGDGSTNIVQLHNPITDLPYVSVSSSDTLIFRKAESDGSVTITDVNLLDTRISGGSLAANGSAYVTATGLTPEEIVIDGDKFVTPDQVPAPEENLPGQVLDSLSIKVYTSTNPGSTPLQAKVLIGDGVTKIYNIGLTVAESKSVMVYVDKIKQEIVTDYAINFVDNIIEFETAPAVGTVIEIISIGIGGIGLIDYQEFVADGTTSLFLTKAVYSQTAGVLVTVDGVAIDAGFVNSGDFIDTKDRTMVQFGESPSYRQVVKIICFGPSTETDSTGYPFVRINQQTVVYDGSNRSFDLDKFVPLSRGSALSAMLVEVNGVQLKGVDTTYVVYNGTNSAIEVGVDPDEVIGTITSGSIKVYINGNLQRFVIDYTYNGNLNLIEIPAENLTVGDIIRIETDTRTEFSVVGGNIVIDSDLTLTIGDTILITWFSEYPTMDMISDEYAGGKVQYQLPRNPLDANYVWIYKNGVRLTRDRDYSVSLPRGVVYLNETTTVSDEIKIVQFGNIVYEPPKAFEIYKDMLNNYHYKRHSRKNSVKLVSDVNYYDTSIEVTDASLLPEPLPTRNIPGVIIVNNERIEYFSKVGNVISQLRRGSLGTAIAEKHNANSFVVNAGFTETLPYVETQERTDFTSDGSTLLIGPLDFIPTQSSRTEWYRETIPAAYGPCDSIEVFVGGKRLNKNHNVLYSEELGVTSPAADITVEAEFSVDGIARYIRLTEPVLAGTRITVIRKQGRIWYERGQLTASKGISLLANDTPVADFIANSSTELPE